MESPRGKIRIQVDSGTDTATEIVTLKPGDIQITGTIITKATGETIHRIHCYGATHAYVLRGISLEDWDKMVAKAEQEVKEDGQ